MRITTRSRRASTRLSAGLATAALALVGLGVAPALADDAAPGTEAAADVVASTFEDESTAPWRGRGGAEIAVTDAEAASGSRSMLVSGRTANWHGVEMPLAGNFVPGEAYQVAAKVRLAQGTEATEVYITAAENDQNYVRVGATPVSDAGWADISGTYTVGTDVVSGTLYFEAASDIASFYLDDIRITGAQADDPDNDGADTGNTGDCPAAQASTKPAGLDDSQPLFESLPFPLGAAIQAYATTEPAARAALDQNFNQVTPENFMKVEAWYDGPWQFTSNNAEADALMTWGAETGKRVYGHVLVWHSQTPDWFFQDDEGNFLTDSDEHKAIARERMRTHIFNVAKYLSDRYGAFGSDTNPLVAFDVVNEVVADGANPASNGLRTSYWYQILGEEFIDLAFLYADEAFNGTYAASGSDHPIALFINEYNTENGTGAGTKTARYRALVERLLGRGVPIDGVGHQSHVSLATNVSNLAAAMDLFDDLPVVQAVTEMDVPTGTPVTEDLLRRQGAFYRSAFDIFRKQQADDGNVFSVTLWGLADYRSWRTCSGAPLAFDNDYDGKWAYAGILGLDIPRESQSMTVFGAADASDPASDTWSLMRGTAISDSAAFQARWNAEGIVVRVDIDDADVEESDAVTLMTADREYTISRNTTGVDGLSDLRVEDRGDGWSVTVTIPMGGLEAGNQVRFEASVSDAGEVAGWNGGGLLGTLILAEDLSTVAAPKTDEAPVVDGIIDEAWDGAVVFSTDKQIEGADGASAQIRALWSQSGESSALHLLFEVADSTPDVSSSEVHEQDSVEVFLDLGNLKSESYQDTDMQLRVNRENVTTFGTGNVGEQEQRVTSAVVPTETGYIVEVAIDLLSAGGDNTVQGFDAQVNDGVDGRRASVRIWADPTGNSWRSPAHWGTMRLLPAPAADEPTVVIDASKVRRGQVVSITGMGFVPGGDVTATFHSDPVVIGTAPADEEGTVGFEFTIPADAELGEHEVRLVQESSGLSASVALEVVGSDEGAAEAPDAQDGAVPEGKDSKGSGGLAVTGASALALTLAAAMLGGLGIGAHALRRRSRA